MSKSPRRKRLPRFEQLEQREMFARDSAAFAGYGSLTFSIAPDDTHVGRESSVLQNAFNKIAPTAQWQEAIAKAFQKWSVHTNVNLGNVPDNGAASGVYGPTRGDERFGDIRITGFDFAEDTYAEAVSENSRSVGTWAGDVFFNTAVDWTNLQTIEAAALHEVGHILGLGHSNDPASPMYEHGPSNILELTQQDIANVQAIHGARDPDPNELGNGNNTISRASQIRGSEDDQSVSEGFNGSQVWIQFGDLLNASDRDVYEIRTSLNYSGPLAVEIRTSGLSLAKLRAELTDRNGQVLASADVAGNLGGVSVLTLNTTTPEGRYYLQVHSGASPLWSTGDYSITIASPTRLHNDADSIAAWSRKAHRWYYDSDRTKNGFSYQLLQSTLKGPETDDNHSDDTVGSSVDVPSVLSTPSRTVHQIVGTISDLTDVDHFRVIAPKILNGQSELVVDLESLHVGGLVPSVRLLDTKGVALDAEVRVQGFGQTQVVFSNVHSEQAFIIELKAVVVDAEFMTGSFALNATFAEPTAKPELLLAGILNTASGPVEREWYIARPQLFGLSLEGLTTDPSMIGQIWVTIFDDKRRMVTGFVAPLNSLRSAPGVFLNPGQYFFQIATAANDVTPLDVSFRFIAERPSQPVGPLLGGTQVQPVYLCPGSTTEYCYPGSVTPTVVTQYVGNKPPIALPVPKPTVVAPAPNAWFWTNNFLPTNPTNALDVSSNGIVDPLDALAIINAVNALGVGPVPAPPVFRGHLDTNADGLVDPLDVLLVINYLNSNGLGK